MSGLVRLRGSSLHLAMMALLVFPAFLAMGYSMSFLGGVTSFPVMYHRFHQLDTSTTTGSVKSHNALVQGVVVALFTLGALVGALSMIPVGNKLGRRSRTFYGALIALIGSTLQTTSYGIAQLCVGRILLGVGIGQLTSTLPSWQAETNRSGHRGRSVVFGGLSITTGAMSASWITFGFSHFDTTKEWTWRVPSIPPIVCMIVVMMFTHSFPESPRLLVLKGKVDQARQTFALLSNVEPQSESVTYELEDCVRVNEIIGESASVIQAFKWTPEKTPYRVLIALLVMFFTSFSGAGLITYYSNQLFDAIGVSATDAKIMGATALTFKMLCCLIPYFCIEKMGRRLCFMLASGGMAGCMWCLAICGSQLTEENRTPAYIGAVFAYLFNFFFPLAYDSVNWLYPQEVVTTRYRAAVSGMSCAVHWLGNFTVAFTTPIGFQSIGYKFYFVWAIICTAAVPVVFFYFPETTGLSMEEIDKVFLESPSVLQTRHTAVKCRREKRETGHVVLEGFGEDSKAEATHCEEK